MTFNYSARVKGSSYRDFTECDVVVTTFLKEASHFWAPIPTVSMVVPFWGLPFRILNMELVKPKKRNYNGDHR